MKLHALHRSDDPDAPDDAARVLLRAHLDARSYRPCVAAAPALRLPQRYAGERDLRAAAALAVAHTFGLLDATQAEPVAGFVAAGLDGAADDALARADAETVLTWCIAAAEWCERHGLDLPHSRLQARAEAADAGAPPWLRVHWRIASAWHHEAFGRRCGVATLLAQAQALAAGDVGLQVVVWLQQARLQLSRSAPLTALALAERAAAHGDARSTPLWLAHAADACARVALARADMHAALQHARRAVGLGEAALAPPAYTMTYRLYEGYALLGLGAWDEAVALSRQLAAITLPARLTERIRLLAQLFELVRDDRSGVWSERSTDGLRRAVQRLRELDWPDVLALLPQTIGRLWVRALDAGIELDWLRASIVARDLPPPQPVATQAWPWRVRVSVLGPFALQVEGHEGAAGDGGKAAAKPLELLRRIAVEAGYDGAPADALAEGLWPGEGREGRSKALEVTLARLRKLLGHADTVLVHERRLRLNPQRVWLDSAALAALAPAGEDAAARAEHALALWRGPLLDGDADGPWLEAHRRRWRMRMAALLLACEPSARHALVLRACAADPGLACWLDAPA